MAFQAPSVPYTGQHLKIGQVFWDTVGNRYKVVKKYDTGGKLGDGSPDAGYEAIALAGTFVRRNALYKIPLIRIDAIKVPREPSQQQYRKEPKRAQEPKRKSLELETVIISKLKQAAELAAKSGKSLEEALTAARVAIDVNRFPRGSGYRDVVIRAYKEHAPKKRRRRGRPRKYKETKPTKLVGKHVTAEIRELVDGNHEILLKANWGDKKQLDSTTAPTDEKAEELSVKLADQWDKKIEREGRSDDNDNDLKKIAKSLRPTIAGKELNEIELDTGLHHRRITSLLKKYPTRINTLVGREVEYIPGGMTTTGRGAFGRLGGGGIGGYEKAFVAVGKKMSRPVEKAPVTERSPRSKTKKSKPKPAQGGATLVRAWRKKQRRKSKLRKALEKRAKKQDA